MSLTYGPKHLVVSVPDPSYVSVLTNTGAQAVLSSPVSITSDGSVTFTVASPGHYVVVVDVDTVEVRDKIFLTDIPEYDITDPRSYANYGPEVAQGVYGKPVPGFAPPTILATTSTTIPSRASWITANTPGYTGPIIFDTMSYPDFSEATIIAAGILSGDRWKQSVS